MAARFDTHQLFAGKFGAAGIATMCAAVAYPVTGLTLFALVGDSAP